MDRVVSSYTSTVRAMAYARSRPHSSSSTPADPGSMLVVAIPDLPQAPPLPGVTHEADVLRGYVPDLQHLSGSDATNTAVITALGTHKIAHFACHGVSDWQHPAASRLLIHDDDGPLTAAVVSRQQLPDAELAYLSACSTAAPRPMGTDEPAHIAAAFQLAGYPQVIATLWPVSDTSAVRIADQFYRYLTGDGCHPIHTRDSAQALHHSTRLLRTSHPHLPTAWGAHVHIGI
jgi:CHAT domain-containing protein